MDALFYTEPVVFYDDEGRCMDVVVFPLRKWFFV